MKIVNGHLIYGSMVGLSNDKIQIENNAIEHKLEHTFRQHTCLMEVREDRT